MKKIIFALIFALFVCASVACVCATDVSSDNGNQNDNSSAVSEDNNGTCLKFNPGDGPVNYLNTPFTDNHAH